MAGVLLQHCHGKNSVRVLKVVRNSARHEVHEYTMTVRLWSKEYDIHYTDGNNSKLIATDTVKNTTYVVAKTHDFDAPETFATQLAHFFLDKYAFLDRVWVKAEETIWHHASVDGAEHNHGFVRGAGEVNVATVNAPRGEPLVVQSELRNLIVLKTTQTGFAGFLKNEHTTLPDVHDRLLSTNITATWRYVKDGAVAEPNAIRAQVRRHLLDTFFGPAKTGVYSKSVQETLFKMGSKVCSLIPAVATVELSMPNIHYIPFKHLSNLGLSFNDDIYLPTSEPAGAIRATVGKPGQKLRSKL